MMAPLRFPSMDSEFPTAIRICGCAGIAIVRGTWDTDTGGAVALAGKDQPINRVTIADAIVTPARSRMAELELCIVNS